MLDRQPHEEVLTLPNLIAWLEKQPAHRTYPFMEPCKCLLAQFMQAHGFPNAHFGGCKYGLEEGESPFSIPNKISEIAQSKTFGEALQKAYQYAN